jgi:hypothetical protein
MLLLGSSWGHFEYMRLRVLLGGLTVNLCFVFERIVWWGSLGVVVFVRLRRRQVRYSGDSLVCLEGERFEQVIDRN